MALHLQAVTADNREAVLALHPAKEQETWIESTKDCLAEAAKLALWRPVALYDDETLLGFAMYGLWRDEGTDGRVWLDRFLIDESQQGKGYARPLLRLLMAHIGAAYPEYNTLYLSLYADNTRAYALYQTLGFRENGERDVNGERVMCRQA